MLELIYLLEKHYDQYLLCTFLFFLLISIKIFVTFKHKDDKWYEINPKRSIHSHVLFWMSILTPFFIILVLKFPSILMYISKDDFRFYKMFLDRDITKDFLSVVALIAPLSLLVIRMHSSKQTAEQLSNQSRQLTFQRDQFDNQKANDSFKHYLEHRSYIIGKLDNYLKDENCLVTFDSSDLYQKIFPDLGLRNFDFSKIKKPSRCLDEFRDNAISYTHLLLKRFEEHSKPCSEDDYDDDSEESCADKTSAYRREIKNYIEFISTLLDGLSIKVTSNVMIKAADDKTEMHLMLKDNENLYISDVYENISTFTSTLNKICGLSPKKMDDKIEDSYIEIINHYKWEHVERVFQELINEYEGIKII